MENNGGVEGITRREFIVRGGIVAASALFGTGAIGGNAAYADAAQRLQEYREKLFGKYPLLADGMIEKISYEQWKKDEIVFNHGVVEARRFLVELEPRKLYKEALWDAAPDAWLKDRTKVIIALLNGLHVPSLEYHGKIRELLKADGILDFESHKKAVEQGIKDAPAYMKSDAAKAARDVASNSIDDRTIDDVAHGLEYMYALTLPIGNIDEYRKIEDDIRETLRKSSQALERAKNLYEAMDKNDYMKTLHQLKSFMFGLRDVFNAVGRLTEKLPERTGVSEEQKDTIVGKLHFHHPEATFYVFPYIAKEWDDLNLHEWANDVATKAKKLVR